MLADLHCHSTASDGLLTPSALVERACAQGVELLALTDHDTLEGLAEAHAAAAALGLTLVGGVELSCTWGGATIHVLGYNASKAAVWMLTKSVALYCAKMGWDIRCNSVHPTFIDTPILDGIVASSGKPKDVIMGKLGRQIPLGRIGEPDDIASGVLYLASDESRFMTGAELKLDGGISAM